MRIHYLAIPASLLLMAQAGAVTCTVELGAREGYCAVCAPAPSYDIWPHEQDRVSGAYALSNGWRLDIEPSRDGIEARIDKRRPIRLVALSADKFVSLDGNVSMEFNRGDYGTDMLMSYVPESRDPRLAQVIVVKATMAQR